MVSGSVPSHCSSASSDLISQSPSLAPLLKHTRLTPTSGLHTGCSLCWEVLPLNICMSHSLTTFKSLITCHLFNETHQSRPPFKMT